MKVSIITLTNNSEKNIHRCLESIHNQNYSNIEHIIIDNKSSDNTVKIINNYKNKRIKLISEKDNGIYDGWNKGFKLATGDIVGTVMSDDFLVEKNIIEQIVDIFKKKQPDMVYGNMQFTKDGEIIRKWISGNYSKYKFYFGWMPPPPTVYHTKKIIDENELFDTSLKISADYEFYLRLFFKKNYKIIYLNKFIYNLEYGGVSNKSLINIFKSNVESYKSWGKNNLFNIPTFILVKPLFKIFQIINFRFFIKKYSTFSLKKKI